jgi:hypothetical protein
MVTYLCDIVIFKYNPIGIWEYFNYTFYSNWFLWAVFYCSLYGFASKYIFRNRIAGYVILLIINYAIPNVANFAGAKRLFPFFVMGMLIKRYNLIGKLNMKQQIILTVLLAILYPITLRFEMTELVTGMVGSMFAILVCYNICRRFDMKMLQKIGRTSIGIYLMSGILFYFCIKEHLRIDDSYRYLIKSEYVLGLSVVITALCYMVSRLLAKNKVTGRLFMGRV